MNRLEKESPQAPKLALAAARGAPAGPGAAVGARGRAAPPDAATERRMLHTMKLTREIEDRIERKLYRQGKIMGGVYVGRGQEAIGVGATLVIRPDDVICPSHRDMGALLVRGMTPERILAQYMGRRDGYTRGKDGNMHMGDLGHGVVSLISMLADNVPVAAGIALAFQLRGEARVALCFFGDGATSRGDWHEGVNLAAVRRLPVVFVCNNNQYAYSTPLSLQMAVENVADRAPAYGIPGETIDGNDVLAVHEAVSRAVDRARSGGGPTLIECRTFRMTGHSAHDDATYVPRELFEEWREKDPIPRLERHLLAHDRLTRDELDALDRSVAASVDAAVEWAERSPYPEPGETLRDVYHHREGS